MSDEPAEPLTPAERHVRALLGELRAKAAPTGRELTLAVVRTARWQRPARRLLLTVATTAGALATGVGSLFRAYRRR